MKLLDRLKDALRSPSRIATVHDSVRHLNQRLETVRTELLFELRYGQKNDPKGGELIKKVILAPEKLQSTFRLNLGCGHLPMDGFVNVDMRELPGVDIVAPINDIPVPVGAAAEIFSSHVLEHFPQEELRRNLLPYWASLLKPGGIFRAIVPDGEAMLMKVADGSYPFHDFREVLFGSQDYTGDFHYNMFTPESLTALLRETGFENITILAKGRKNGRCYEFEIKAAWRGN